MGDEFESFGIGLVPSFRVGLTRFYGRGDNATLQKLLCHASKDIYCQQVRSSLLELPSWIWHATVLAVLVVLGVSVVGFIFQQREDQGRPRQINSLVMSTLSFYRRM